MSGLEMVGVSGLIVLAVAFMTALSFAVDYAYEYGRNKASYAHREHVDAQIASARAYSMRLDADTEQWLKSIESRLQPLVEAAATKPKRK